MHYTEDQLTRELQLLVTELALLNDFAIGEDAGLRALGLDESSDFAQSRHPDDLGEVRGMAVSKHIERIERYVRDQQWHDAIAMDVSTLRIAVGRVFSPVVLQEYETERIERAGPESIPLAFEEGAADLPLGFFHRGILADLVAAAAARLKVDQGERLTMADIALLLDAREQTVITNAHRKNFPTIEDENRRYAEPTEVLPWLLKQGYRPTQMPEQHLEPESDTPAIESDDEALVFVPVARDGSWFGPDCRSGGRFTIGAKGTEVKYGDYFEALDALIKMPTPHWRRPNSNGVPGIVTGVRFDRKRRSDIEQSLT